MASVYCSAASVNFLAKRQKYAEKWLAIYLKTQKASEVFLTFESFVSSLLKSFGFCFFFRGVLARILRCCWGIQINGFDLFFDLLLLSVTN
jgi:hypothetical protein